MIDKIKKISPYMENFGQVILDAQSEDGEILEQTSKANDYQINKITKALTLSDNKNLIDKDLEDIIKNKKLGEFFSDISLYSISKHENNEKILKHLNFRFNFQNSSNRLSIPEVPPYLLLEPASACNLRCPMCFQIDKTFTRKPYMGIMDWDFFCRIVDEANEIGIGAVTLGSRGEPTLHPRYADMIEYVSKKENIFEVKTNTNATFLDTNKIHKLLESDIDTIVISADHYEKKTYEKLRKGANFEKILINVEQLHKIREKHYPKSKTKIRISGIDYYKNLDKKKFYTFWKKYSDDVSVAPAIERWDTYKNDPKNDNITTPCSYIWDRMYIWWDGICNPCDSDYKSYLQFGDAKKNTIKEIWNSNRHKELIKIHTDGNRKKKTPCDRCGIKFK